ncbi:MAG: phosphoglucomutase (alpha-D-glucose-1,6-bisphosphate-dependent) [Gemmatimonadaceae bacterium]
MSPNIDARAGKPATQAMLENIPRLVTAYYSERPDPSSPRERVSFGTSGHRGSALDRAFNEWHILAITQAICEYRAANSIAGPLFLGADTHALSEPAWASALEVLAANGVAVMIDDRGGFTPTPVISHAIITHNAAGKRGLADGIVVTPSHNPPRDGGFKYNPPNGGPADTQVTSKIEARANELLEHGLAGVKRVPLERARTSSSTTRHNFVTSYVNDLDSVVNMDALRGSGLRLGVDPLGGAGVAYWPAIAEHYGVAIDVVSDTVDPTFRFMTVDWDGRIRMDCSSPYAMQRLIAMKERYDVAWACDTDHDRHGIVVRDGGLLNPNHYLAAAISYLYTARKGWPAGAGIGKTIVSSSMIDRVAKRLTRDLIEVPVGFKWFVDGFTSRAIAFGGEESAGASLLRRDGSVWTTDKDGIVLGLLAAEMTAVSGNDPGVLYGELTRDLGESFYERIDTPATPEQKRALRSLAPAQVVETEMAGEPILQKLTAAPGNGAAIGGLKVVTANGWFAARPSGTEDVCKLYAESFLGAGHLAGIQDEAQAIIRRVLDVI